jgi:hypothetical protein
LSWQKSAFTIYNLKKSSPEVRLGPERGEFVPVGIEGRCPNLRGGVAGAICPSKRNPRNRLEDGAERRTWKTMFGLMKQPDLTDRME